MQPGFEPPIAIARNRHHAHMTNMLIILIRNSYLKPDITLSLTLGLLRRYVI